MDAHAVLFAGNSLRLLLLILFSSSSSSSSIALLVLLVLLRRRGDDDDDVNASSLVLFPSMMISSTKDDGFGVDETNATSRRQKKTTHIILRRVSRVFCVYIYFSDFSPWCSVSEARRELEQMRTFFLRLECMLGCAETPFLVKINKLISFVHHIKLIISAFRRERSIDGERDVPIPSIHRGFV